MNKVCALIPARGGSKRIPNKNLIPINGVPMIGRTIIAALKSKIIEEVWVSTDSPEIATISKQYGAQVLIRPSELCQDTSSSEDALFHFVNNVPCDVLVFIQCTSPILNPEHLNIGVVLVTQSRFDSVLSVSEDKRFYWNDSGAPINYSLSKRPRMQDKDAWLMETGSFYITKTSFLKLNKCRISGEIGFVYVPKYYSVDIDNPDDLIAANAIAKLFDNGELI